jgi:hypothetical protein
MYLCMFDTLGMDESENVLLTDLEINGLECVWVELKRKNKKVLYGTFHVLLSSPFQRLKFSLSHVR